MQNLKVALAQQNRTVPDLDSTGYCYKFVKRQIRYNFKLLF